MLREKWGVVKSQVGPLINCQVCCYCFFLVYTAELAHAAQVEDVGYGPRTG
jgi:hypothetical protein